MVNKLLPDMRLPFLKEINLFSGGQTSPLSKSSLCAGC